MMTEILILYSIKERKDNKWLFLGYFSENGVTQTLKDTSKIFLVECAEFAQLNNRWYFVRKYGKKPPKVQL
jgi:uncharacterized protein YchJ